MLKSSRLGRLTALSLFSAGVTTTALPAGTHDIELMIDCKNRSYIRGGFTDGSWIVTSVS